MSGIFIITETQTTSWMFEVEVVENPENGQCPGSFSWNCNILNVIYK